MGANLTLDLPADLLRQAEAYAAQHETTVAALVQKLLERTVNVETDLERSRAALKRLQEIAHEGPLFEGDPASIKREDLYRNFDHIFRKPER
jgi:hypothetical protein